MAVPADLTDAHDRERLVAEVTERVGPIDILVNNAGAVNATAIEHESLDDFSRMIELNLTASWHLMKMIGASMVERRRGSIINIASILGVVGATPAKDSGYTAAKGGLVNLTREMGLQWARMSVSTRARPSLEAAAAASIARANPSMSRIPLHAAVSAASASGRQPTA